MLLNPSGGAVCVSLIGLLIDFPHLCETPRTPKPGPFHYHTGREAADGALRRKTALKLR